MRKINNKMKKFLNNMSEHKINEIKIIDIEELFSPNFTLIHDYVLINNNDSIEKDINISFIEKNFKYKSMYEYSYNEVQINYHLAPENNIYATRIGILILNAWKYKLKFHYPNFKFCIIMNVSEINTIISFHRVRESEGLIMNEDLETYQNNDGILVEVF